ncbi:hypothetical protein CLV67_13162 [Actinoplanes italicus]|uniref:Uncharacterized protein n=1 Tax=Actinoplanes italicus TaxID=113567 RepID=A0A2T0JV03_9ACTN|nr:hypothetical protein CLV67_13162 [Actinoplanes italicus]
MFGPRRGDVDRLRAVNRHIRATIVQWHILQPDIEVGVSVPVRPRGGVQRVRQEPGQAVVPLGRTRTHENHPVHDLDARALLFSPCCVLLGRDLLMHPGRRHHLGSHTNLLQMPPGYDLKIPPSSSGRGVPAGSCNAGRPATTEPPATRVMINLGTARSALLPSAAPALGMRAVCSRVIAAAGKTRSRSRPLGRTDLLGDTTVTRIPEVGGYAPRWIRDPPRRRHRRLVIG